MRQTDSELLRRYVAEKAEPAFAELVHRHIDLVFSAALRQTGGDRQMAEEVTQGVFTDLARKASRLQDHTSLAGWLYTSTRYGASSARRSDRRRQVREQQAIAMQQLLPPEPSVDWDQLRPLLDEAMHALNESDRQAVLLRFFNHLPLAEVGAHLAVSENTARMRVDRALDKLRGYLEKRGFATTGAVLAALLSNHAVAAAPTGLAAAVTPAAVAAGATAAAGGLTAWIGAKGLLATAGVVAILVVVSAARHYADPNPPGPVPKQAASKGNSAALVAATNPSPEALASPFPAESAALTLQVLNATNDAALGGVQVDFRAWSKGVLDHRTLATDAQGICVAPYLADTTNLVLITEQEGYADTKLSWEPDRGEAIPQTYTVRPGAAAPIAGRVVNEQGRPIAGATVEWSAEPNYSALGRLGPESHCAEGISATTDASGQWQVNRVAGDLFPRLSAYVTHPEYTPGYAFPAADPALPQKLRDGSLLVTLRPGVTVRGMVSDTGARPVAGARVVVGFLEQPKHRQAITLSDGTFEAQGCSPEESVVSAEADGYAPAGVRIDLSRNTARVRLTMQPPQTLRLRVASPDGVPISGANVRYLPRPFGTPLRDRDYKDLPALRAETRSGHVVTADEYPDLAVAQVTLRDKTRPDGRLTWTNAPSGVLMLRVQASGFTISGVTPARADGQEHLITLTPHTLVTGTVRDESNGALIPRFRVVPGFPERQPFFGRTQIHWIANELRDFTDGAYEQDLNRPLVIGPDNPGYVLKFEATGYEPVVSRSFEEGEGEVHLDVALRPSQGTVITVLKPNGQPVAGAGVGLVSPNAELRLSQGSFIRDPLTTAVLETEVDGRFRLPTDPSVTRIIIACVDGYLSATPESLKAASSVRLEPWGAIEGTCVADGKPVAGQKYMLALEGESFNTVMCGFEAYKVETDAQGRFTIQRAPPGNHNLQRVTTGIGPNGEVTSWGPQGQTPVTVRPGETTTVTLQP